MYDPEHVTAELRRIMLDLGAPAILAGITFDCVPEQPSAPNCSPHVTDAHCSAELSLAAHAAASFVVNNGASSYIRI